MTRKLIRLAIATLIINTSLPSAKAGCYYMQPLACGPTGPITRIAYCTVVNPITGQSTTTTVTQSGMGLPNFVTKAINAPPNIQGLDSYFVSEANCYSTIMWNDPCNPAIWFPPVSNGSVVAVLIATGSPCNMSTPPIWPPIYPPPGGGQYAMRPAQKNVRVLQAAVGQVPRRRVALDSAD